MRPAHIATALTIGLMLLPSPTRARAQEPMDPRAVRDAVIRELSAKHTFGVRAHFVSDSAELSAFVRCARTRASSARRCVLTDTVPVVLVRVIMPRPDSARVLIGRYRMFDARCPSGTRIDPPLIAVENGETRTFLYQSGRWIDTGRRTRVVC